MINFSSIIDVADKLLNSERKYTMLVLIVSSSIVWYFYDANTALTEKVNTNEAHCSEQISQVRKDSELQLTESRRRQQTQLDLFIEDSNKKQDSLYKVLSKQVRIANQRLDNSIETLKNH